EGTKYFLFSNFYFTRKYKNKISDVLRPAINFSQLKRLNGSFCAKGPGVSTRRRRSPFSGWMRRT
ncbi:TPA: hypothetical protein ACY3K3_001867, partial [Enterobacter cloacae]